MLIGFLDDTEIVVDGDDSAPDIFVFGGYFIPFDCLEAFQKRIRAVKGEHGIPPWGPVKWNLRDTGLLRFYNADHCLSPESYELLRQQSTPIRSSLLGVLKEFNAKVFISARHDTHWREVNHAEYYDWAFENLFQRVGLLFEGGQSQPSEASSTVLVVDWPPSGVEKRLFDVYMGGYYFGRGLSSHQGYYSGHIQQYRFLESLTHGSTLHSGPLQLADLVVGCCRDFIHWAYKGSDRIHRIGGMFEPLIDCFARNNDGRLNDCGFKIAKGNHIDIEAKIEEYRAWLRAQEEDAIPF